MNKKRLLTDFKQLEIAPCNNDEGYFVYDQPGIKVLPYITLVGYVLSWLYGMSY